MILALLTLLALPPIPAARFAARVTGASERALVHIVWRESRGARVGVHEGDAWASRRVCRKAKARGWVYSEADCRSGQWSSRGPFGLMAAYHLRFVGLDRFPWVLDIPVVSAFAAARKWQAQCPGRAFGWCPKRRRDA